MRSKNFSSFSFWIGTITLVIFFASALQAQTFRVLYSFQGKPDGAVPMGSLIRNNQGTIYGTTSKGGAGDWGTVFKLDRYGRQTALYNFGGDDDGWNPVAGLVGDANTTLYGSTDDGGTSYFWGTLFKLDKYGNHTVVINFTGSENGAAPQGRLLRDAQGNLYGSTNVGGNMEYCSMNGCGLIFKIDSLGQETVLHKFHWDTGWGPNELFRDAAGNFYSTTKSGGSGDVVHVGCCGTIFKLDTNNQKTVLYRFTGGADGKEPYSGVARDADGNFYGTTCYGGSSGNGVAYKLDGAGSLTVLHTFTGGSDGANPHGGLTWNSKGELYGTTVNGGAYGYGVVFKVTKSGTYTVLHHFTGGTDGAHPYATLFRDPGDAMYGTASEGGTAGGPCGTKGCGTVFVITP
jgi:uncharacterized repeat protein (TIGR03803 family)